MHTCTPMASCTMQSPCTHVVGNTTMHIVDAWGIGWGKRRGWESHVQRGGTVRGIKGGEDVALACIVHAMHTWGAAHMHVSGAPQFGGEGWVLPCTCPRPHPTHYIIATL